MQLQLIEDLQNIVFGYVNDLTIYDTLGNEYYINFQEIEGYMGTYDIVKVVCNRTWIINGTFKLRYIIDIVGNVCIIGNATNFFTNIFFYIGSVNHWDMSLVTSMKEMFAESNFNGDISGWDVSSVTTMHGMFKYSDFNGDISGWDVSKVTNMREMFAEYSKFRGYISGWDVSKVTNMKEMFAGSKFNGDISRWDMSSVTSMEAMFTESQFNGDISG
jgi:surface protein